ncbi:unnamed protein product [Cochlearia groenlandica]
MYVTRLLSEYRKNITESKQTAPEGPNSGVLIIQDEESKPTSCFGSYYAPTLKGLPFPQNAEVTTEHSFKVRKIKVVNRDPTIFIPVLDQPLSSNRYYAVKGSGKNSGKASANAKEEDKVPCCIFFKHVPEAKPQEADPNDIYQQFEINQPKPMSTKYFAKSVAPNGIPPEFLKIKYWTAAYAPYAKSQDYGLRDDAKGIDSKLRGALTSDLNTSVAVGKWYVPFIFVSDGDVKEQIKRSTYYNMNLYQRWEEVYSCENAHGDNREVVVNVEVEAEVGSKTRSVDGNGIVWFGVANKKVGLKSAVVDRMKWEEERFGWKSDPQGAIVKRSERFNGVGLKWKKYRCYVLVESFVLRRRDDSLVLTFELRHVDKLRTKWES